MNKNIINRVYAETDYILKTSDTLRDMAKIFKISKSTIHKDLHERLKEIDVNKFEEVDKILSYHKDVRHIRGGESTKKKYLKL